jgi:hypothetical protein
MHKSSLGGFARTVSFVGSNDGAPHSSGYSSRAPSSVVDCSQDSERLVSRVLVSYRSYRNLIASINRLHRLNVWGLSLGGGDIW